MTRSNHVRQIPSGVLSDALVTLAVVGVAFLALDDITTDTAVSFPLERTALAGCAAWFAIVAWRLVRERHRILGGLSFSVIAIAALVQPAVGPGMVSTRFEYLATLGTLMWFVVLSGILAGFAWRRGNRCPA